MRQCQQTHPNCRGESEIVGDNFPWRPTRLLDVSANQLAAEDFIYLVQPVKSSQRYEYVTLSYCWGLDPSFSKLTSKNLNMRQAGIPVNTLPKTFIDAVDATRRLGFQYLWIDALCIIQDSREDWLEQSLLMSKVFAYSALTIAATASSDVHGGLYRDRDPALVNGVDIAIRWPKLNTYPLGVQVYRVGLWSPWGSLLAHSPLAQRGWAFQERMLPSRTLHFADRQVYWECFNHSASERYPAGTLLYVDAKDSLASRMVKQLKPLMALARIAEEIYVPYDVWSGIVEAYSRSKLTYESDKLVALAGLAMEIAQIFQRDGYLAGLWQSGLPYSLMWTANGDTDNAIVRPRKYRAPSWSWASLDGSITFPDIFKNAVAEVIDVAVSTERDVFGPVIDGSLILKGLLLKLPQDLLAARFLCKTRVFSLPFYEGPAGFRLWWDRYQEDINQQPDAQSIFCLPITAQYLSQNPHPIIREPDLQSLKRQQHIFRGLLLEPLSKIKGRFRRVGDFEIVTSRSSIPGASSFKKLLPRMGRLGEYNPAEERLPVDKIGAEFYREFDGVDKYTIEIV
jgi:Heterokaryon incompatibility protein (HET)